ncbi:MAG: hypothetical protein HY867_01230 [Chloroflexi bacterium]|nr:hypothetical protein [Chloroflexota bacterium]
MNLRFSFLFLILGMNLVLAGCSPDIQRANLPSPTATELLKSENRPSPTATKTAFPQPIKSALQEQTPLPISVVSNDTLSSRS